MKEMIQKNKGRLICSAFVMCVGMILGYTCENSLWVVLHLDNDKVGRLCTATLKLLQKDYKIVDDPPPVGKDFKDFLLSYLEIARPMPKRERSDAR